ncbi:MAG: hypothetical protein AAGF89_09040, partial [Bacteroidota bacterium]
VANAAILEDWHVQQAHTGLSLTKAIVMGGKISEPIGQFSTGVHFATSRQPVVPRIQELMVHGYTTGIDIRGNIQAGGYLSKLQFHQVNQVISLPATSPVMLSFPDGADWLLPSQTSKHHHQKESLQAAEFCHTMSSSEAMMEHSNTSLAAKKKATPLEHHGAANDHKAHVHQHAPPPSKMVHLVPPNHPSGITSDSKINDWSLVPEKLVGDLSISTGFGMSDPVHEHDHPLHQLGLSSGEVQHTYLPEGQEHSLILGVGKIYSLQVDFTKFYDLSLEWTSTTEAPVLIKIPYPHEHPLVFRSLGAKLPRLTSVAQLRQDKRSAWYYDDVKKEVFLALRAGKHPIEVILYSEEVEASISAREASVPVRVATDAATGMTNISYQLSGEQPAKLTLTDIFGIPYSSHTPLPNERGWVDLQLPPSTTAPPPQSGWYFLEVDGGMFKGPVTF